MQKMSSAQTKSHHKVQSGSSSGLLSWLKQYGFWLLLGFATLLVLWSTWFAWQQKPHPDAYRVTPGIMDGSAFWAYPVEQNAFQRLLKINVLLKDIFVLDQKIWAVGEGGFIIHSDDGGYTWQQQTSGATRDIEGISFHDALQGWMVGGHTIFSTTDGGQTWQQQTSEIGRLLDISFHDALHGWAVGLGGEIFSTTDGGQKWQKQTSGTRRWLLGISFHDALQGWAVGNGGTILSTTDGGKTWQQQTSGTTNRLRGISFHDALQGWAVGDAGTILSTTDGGQTWQKQTSGWGGNLSGIGFNDVLQGWAAGRDGTILSTTDGGKTWQQQASGRTSRLYSISFNDTLQGWAVGGGGTILSTIDGGNTWHQQTSGTTSWLLGVSFHDALQGWAVGGGGTILSTIDGGQTWQPQTSGTTRELEGITFHDALQGWSVGGGGTILSTIDGGQTWRQTSVAIRNLKGISFYDGLQGWAVGEFGVILSTTDGGQTWQKQASGLRRSSILDISFHDARQGWAVGDGGMILSTTDGGQTWQKQTSGTSYVLYGISFHDALHGWVAGWDGTILSTTDGGQTWQQQTSGTTSDLYDITFHDALQGWAVGDSGTILSTTDGGKTWHEITYQRYPAPWFYLALFITLLMFVAAFWLRARQIQQINQEQSVPSLDDHVVTDKPAGPGGADLMGARRIASGLTRFMTNENTQPPLTIAITGEWGSGKSSVMNYLSANLKREGLKPVWFNAWHHREEQNVLASMLENIHKQAINPWWHLSGLFFRLRLIWRRHWVWKAVVLLLLVSLSFLSTWLVLSPDKRDDAVRYLRYLVKIDQPVVLSEAGFNQLCANWVQHHGDEARHVDLKDETQAVESKLKPREKPAVSHVLQQTHISDYFTTVQCQKLFKIHAHKRITRDDLNAGCIDKVGQSIEDNACYASPEILLDNINFHFGDLSLSHKDEVKLKETMDFLSPESPIPLPAELTSILTMLFAVLAFFAYKGMALLGFAPAQFLQRIFRQTGVTYQANEQVGTRLLFKNHFEQITKLLGRRRLVLFIDDLDRCDCEHTRQVLEISNFLSSSGELFMVIGMAPRYVLANVTLSFQEVAQAVHEADILNGTSPEAGHNPNAGQSWFARHYLQKLIHIEVPVPKPKPDDVKALLTAERQKESAEEIESTRIEMLEQRIESFLNFVGKFVRWLLLATALGGGAFLAWNITSDTGIPSFDLADKTVAAEINPVTTPSGDEGDPGPSTKEPIEIKKESPSSDSSFKPGYNRVDHFVNWPMWLSVSLVVSLGVICAAFFFFIHRLEQLNDKKWLVWLTPLLQRLKVTLVGPESSKDSVNFVDALKIWYPLITQKDPTPRTIKAFINRLRYFSSLRGKGREAHLVALATLFYRYDDDIDAILPVLENYVSNQTQLTKCDFAEKWPDLANALEQHKEAFSDYPSDEDIEFYKMMSADICIHRRD